MAKRSLKYPPADGFDDLSALRGDHDSQVAYAELESIHQHYTNAGCDRFAATLAAATGWTVVALAAPGRPLQRLVAMPAEAGGQLVDVTGFVSESDLQRRYGADSLAIGPVLPPGLGGGHDHLEVVQLLTRLDYRPFNALDFQRQLLAFGATLEVGPELLPTPVSPDELLQAARHNDLATVNRFLAQAQVSPAQDTSADHLANLIFDCGEQAVDEDRVDVIKAFLDATDVPMKFDDNGFSWLHSSILARAKGTIQLLLVHPRSAHLVNLAANNSNIGPPIGPPLRACLSMDWGDSAGATKLAMAELFLAHGASPWSFDEDGNAALHWAVKAGLAGFVQTLIEQGIPVDHTGPEKGVPPLFRAVECGTTEMVDVLRALGADVAAYSRSGRTLLTHCIDSAASDDDKMSMVYDLLDMKLPGANPHMVRYLVGVVGFDPSQADLNGDTAHALAKGMPQVRAILDACRARRAIASVLAAAGASVTPPHSP